MNRIKSILQREDFRVFLFCIALILFIYPLFASPLFERLDRNVIFLFIVWLIVIAVLFVSSGNRKETGDEEDEKNNRDV